MSYYVSKGRALLLRSKTGFPMKTFPFPPNVNDDRFIKAFKRAMIVANFGISGEISVSPSEFRAHKLGRKRHEVVLFNQGFQRKQVIVLRERDYSRNEFTGAELFALITHITAPGSCGLPNNLGVISTRLL